MKVKRITEAYSDNVVDCYVQQGYLQGGSSSLPDVDNDFCSLNRSLVKSYTEERYNHNGKQRVFSAGTFTTLQMKAVIKDVARTLHIPPSTVNYMTAILPNGLDYTSLFQFAYSNKKIKKFIQDYPQLFEAIRTLLYQPRSSSIHASALIITPDTVDGEDVECFDVTPIKKIDGQLVSEFDGYQLDSCGLLKNDYLATKELSKLKATMRLIKEHYGVDLSLEKLVMTNCDDPEVYEIFRMGHTQNVFQFSSDGITKFLKEMQPDNINDLIAANALYRPATLSTGSADDYVNRKRGLGEAVYKWGTYNALKDTFATLCYQEQVATMVREIGGFSLAEGVKLVKFISKKKQDKIDALKEKFLNGAKQNGCPDEDAVAIWSDIEACGSYLFNKSHATAYALTAYAGAYMKAHFPAPFYTVALEWAEQKELASLMAEMDERDATKIVPPEINHSGTTFTTDYEANEIYWSLAKIKMVGQAASYIVAEREKYGSFSSLDNFLDRIFKYKFKIYKYWDDPDNPDEAVRCPVNARHVRNLILSGCFDKVEEIGSVCERYGLLMKAAEKLGFALDPKEYPDEMLDKFYFWSQQQILVSGLGAIDYKRIYDSSHLKTITKGWTFRLLKDCQGGELDGHRAVICVTATDFEEHSFVSQKTGKNERFAKVTIQQNGEISALIAWPEDYKRYEEDMRRMKGHIVLMNVLIRYSSYTGKNEFMVAKTTKFEIL